MKPLQWIIALASLTSLVWIQNISRADFYLLWCSYSLAFLFYVLLVFSRIAITFQQGLLIAIASRLAGLFFEPMLSDDFFRFIWDGMIMHQGINPMAYIPSYLVSHPEIVQTDPFLFSKLNSPDYHSVYPPVAQLIFYSSFAFNGLHIGGNILFYKFILLLADIFIILLLARILRKENQSTQRALIYGLNPLIIIEYTGNLHMEGLMITGLLGALVFSEKQKVITSSIAMAFSISSKMLSGLLMPFMPKEMYPRKIISWGMLTLFITAFIFWITFGFYRGWIESVSLWFRSFEFNASLYYIFREVDALWRGYEDIRIVGPVMAILTLLMIAIAWMFYLKRKELHWSSAMVIVLTIYFLMTTTLHPWYLGTLLALSVISRHSFPMVWTYLVFLSYSHYANGGFSENYVLICLEYILLFVWMHVEFRLNRRLVVYPPAP